MFLLGLIHIFVCCYLKKKDTVVTKFIEIYFDKYSTIRCSSVQEVCLWVTNNSRYLRSFKASTKKLLIQIILIVVTLIIYINRMIIDRGVFEKEGINNYLPRSKLMTSSCLSIDLWYNLNIQWIQSFSTGYAHVEISGLHYEVNRSYAFFSMKEGKCQG